MSTGRIVSMLTPSTVHIRHTQTGEIVMRYTGLFLLIAAMLLTVSGAAEGAKWVEYDGEVPENAV